MATAAAAAAAASTSTSNTLLMRVTRTARRTHVRGLSRLQEKLEGRVVSWCDLPSDLFGQILCRLPSLRDRMHLSAVCRHWRVCARQHLPRRRLPMRVTRTARGTHVVHVRGFSRLQDEQQCGVSSFVDSPAFAVAGLHWAIRIRYYPGSDDGERGHVRVFVMLLTKGVVARAAVSLLLLDQTTGLVDTVIHRSTWFDAACAADSCTVKLATRSEHVRGDCLKIEFGLDVGDVWKDGKLK